MGSKRTVSGYKYLYQIGGSHVVRVQVPRPLQAALGKSELKKSFGADYATARREYHRTVANFKEQIDTARSSSYRDRPQRFQARLGPTQDEMEAACYSHFQRMMAHLRGKNVSPDGRAAMSRRERLQGFREMLGLFADLDDAGNWEAMSFDVDGLCEQNEWEIDKSSPAYQRLCEMMLRAKVQAYRNEVRKLEGLHSRDPDGDAMFGIEAPSTTNTPKTLGQLVERFTAARSLRWSASTSKNYVIIFRVIEEVCGKDTPLAAVDHDFCIRVRDQLRSIPANYRKMPALAEKSIADAIKSADAMKLPKISPATVNSHLNKMGAIIRYGRDHAWIVGNPMSGIEVPDPVAPEDKRDPFSISQLKVLFASSPWSEPPAVASDRPSRYWAPLIALFTGARLTEICGQRVDEMSEEEGVYIFDFRHRPGDREMKNGKSRKVPVHPELVRLGFWEFVERAREVERDMLFSDVSRHQLGKWGDGTSKWFSRQIRDLGLSGRNLSFHSLRHSFEDALKRIDLHDTPIGNAITGRWSAGVSKNYGGKYPMDRLDDAVRQIAYPGLDLVSFRPHLQEPM